MAFALIFMVNTKAGESTARELVFFGNRKEGRGKMLTVPEERRNRLSKNLHLLPGNTKDGLEPLHQKAYGLALRASFCSLFWVRERTTNGEEQVTLEPLT